MASANEVADKLADKLRTLAIDPDTDGPTFDLLHDAAYIVEEAAAALGYLRNAKIDLETSAKRETAIRTVGGGIRRLEAAFNDARPAVSA